MVLIQKNAPNGLLIGTDLQPALGFRLTVQKSRNQETVVMGDDGDIVFDSVDDLVQSSSMQKAQVSDTAVVQLLTATRVPAGHQK